MAEGGESPIKFQINPRHNLVRKEDIQSALHADIGPNAVLDLYTVDDFTEMGDNFACFVSRIRISYLLDGESHLHAFIVKMNPRRPPGYFNALATVGFRKEIGFYNEILHILNGELEKVNEPKLKFPSVYHSVSEEGQEVIYLEDLKYSDFKMIDRRAGMDREHANLVIKELARLHAASFMMFSREEFVGIDLVERFPLFSEAFVDIHRATEVTLEDLYSGPSEFCAGLLDEGENDKSIAEYIRNLKENAGERLMNVLKYEEPFKVICHGDCWSNNFLFRYNKYHKPVECRMLDMQVVRIGSPALDLNYLLYSSVNGVQRRIYFDDYISNYYSTFASIMTAAKHVVPFTLRELHKEYRAKNLFGLMMGILLIPTAMATPRDNIDVGGLSDEEMKEVMRNIQSHLQNSALTNPDLISRSLSMIEDLHAAGLFKTKK